MAADGPLTDELLTESAKHPNDSNGRRPAREQSAATAGVLCNLPHRARLAEGRRWIETGQPPVQVAHSIWTSQSR